MTTPMSPSGVTLQEIVTASESGDHHFAIWAMRWMSKFIPNAKQHLENHPSSEVRLDFMKSQAQSPRDYAIQRSCPVLGRGGPRLQPTQKRIVRSILDAHWDAWSEEQCPAPPWSDVYGYGNMFPEERLPSVKVAIVCPK